MLLKWGKWKGIRVTGIEGDQKFNLGHNIFEISVRPSEGHVEWADSYASLEFKEKRMSLLGSKAMRSGECRRKETQGLSPGALHVVGVWEGKMKTEK